MPPAVGPSRAKAFGVGITFQVWKNTDYSGKRADVIFWFAEARRRQGGVFTVCLYIVD
ncbi:hypothetical protein GHI72_04320 [Neisseria meningitidis]|nr:hypothetical protein [Neisseria meningitidis]MBG9020328.1 hypothetical protein [Neisseria meningitidis]MBG9030236.1 hypothetical protein [Neisseria meningitidis]MBG9034248.1 hypothetical protein [Neisseria meningitidis]MBG9054427.1 hypothetical protein [Neisseria meningitidis]